MKTRRTIYERIFEIVSALAQSFSNDCAHNHDSIYLEHGSNRYNMMFKIEERIDDLQNNTINGSYQEYNIFEIKQFIEKSLSQNKIFKHQDININYGNDVCYRLGLYIEKINNDLVFKISRFDNPKYQIHYLINKNKEISHSDLIRKTQEIDAETRDQAITNLIQTGKISVEEIENPKRKSRRVYKINNGE